MSQLYLKILAMIFFALTITVCKPLKEQTQNSQLKLIKNACEAHIKVDDQISGDTTRESIRTRAQNLLRSLCLSQLSMAPLNLDQIAESVLKFLQIDVDDTLKYGFPSNYGAFLTLSGNVFVGSGGMGLEVIRHGNQLPIYCFTNMGAVIGANSFSVAGIGAKGGLIRTTKKCRQPKDYEGGFLEFSADIGASGLFEGNLNLGYSLGVYSLNDFLAAVANTYKNIFEEFAERNLSERQIKEVTQQAINEVKKRSLNPSASTLDAIQAQLITGQIILETMLQILPASFSTADEIKENQELQERVNAFKKLYASRNNFYDYISRNGLEPHIINFLRNIAANFEKNDILFIIFDNLKKLFAESLSGCDSFQAGVGAGLDVGVPKGEANFYIGYNYYKIPLGASVDLEKIAPVLETLRKIGLEKLLNNDVDNFDKLALWNAVRTASGHLLKVGAAMSPLLLSQLYRNNQCLSPFVDSVLPNDYATGKTHKRALNMIREYIKDHTNN